MNSLLFKAITAVLAAFSFIQQSATSWSSQAARSHSTAAINGNAVHSAHSQSSTQTQGTPGPAPSGTQSGQPQGAATFNSSHLKPMPTDAGTGSADVTTYRQWIRPTSDGVNIRTAPGTNVPIVQVAAAKDEFPVVGKQGDWLQIALDAKQTGWIAGWLTTPASIQGPAILGGELTKTGVILRDGPGEEFASVASLGPSVTVIPLMSSGLYVEVADSAGQYGWIPRTAISWQGLAPSPTVDSVIALPADANVEENTPMSGKTIVLDPGHGGSDTGAIGTNPAVTEADVNLSVAQVLAQKLRAAGAKVILTRTSKDQTVSLAERVKISNENHADAFVSIHQNMFEQDTAIHGSMTYYYADSSRTLATDVEKQLERGITPTGELRQGTNQDELYVLHHNTRPAILVEGCFLSNPTELTASVTPTYQERLADEIYRGLETYFS